MSTEVSLISQKGPIVIDGISYIPSSVLHSGTEKVSFKDNRAFAVTDTSGECPRLLSHGTELGVYYNDTRYLNTWETTINGLASVPLAHELRFGGNSVVYSMTNRDLPKIGSSGRIPRDSFLIRRILTLIEDTFFETVEIKNFTDVDHNLQIEQWIGSRFDDLFEVRGFPRKKRGRVLASLEINPRVTALQYEGLDHTVRQAYIHRLFDSEKRRLSPSLAGFFACVEMKAKKSVIFKTVVSFDRLAEPEIYGRKYFDLSVSDTMDFLHKRTNHEFLGKIQFKSDNAMIDRSIKNAALDIHMLLGKESLGDDRKRVLYPYAGIPWFCAPFGRDGIITAYQLLPWYPELAKGVIDYTLSHLGTKNDSFTDEQPGKIFHEMRRGEMARTREVPFIPYYGSVDSTPLGLILLHEYICWTKDLKSLRDWWPDALRALEWVDKWGDPDQDGFLEYKKNSPTGLVNQGWKDSHDSIMHRDGRLAEAPIRLCEVQGYAFRARMGMSALAKLMSQEDLSKKIRLDALRLRSRFNEKFWDSAENFIYLALDGDSSPCAVKSSNMGHCLWSQIVSPEQARSVANHLMSDGMFSGYGIRTLSSKERSYNPLSYHNGSIWPHDNSLIVEGFRYYGMTREIVAASDALLGVLEQSEDFRLPELYCGFRKRDDSPPVPYEVACKPQAWAAGSIFLMLKSMLGISIETDKNYVVFNSPVLGSKMQELEIHNLRGADWEMDLRFRQGVGGTSIDVLRKTGDVRVLIVK